MEIALHFIADKYVDYCSNKKSLPLLEVKGEEKYKKIDLTTNDWAIRTAFFIVTCGVSRIFLNLVFQKALEKGNIDLATRAVKWGAADYLMMNDLIKLSKDEKPESLKSLKFLVAQVSFDTKDPTGGSIAAYQFIRARDDFRGLGQSEDYQDKKFLDLVDNKTMPRVHFYVMKRYINWGETKDLHETAYCGLEKAKGTEESYNFASGSNMDLPFDVKSTDPAAVQISETKKFWNVGGSAMEFGSYA